MDPQNEFEHRHKDCDNKVKCSFRELLCVEFDCIFEVNVDIDQNSIQVSCGNGFPDNFDAE
ncbi:MAG: hypothetical protein ACOCQW_05320 [Halanaerobiaceae bacterium]